MSADSSSGEPQEYYFREGCYVTELINQNDDPDVSVARIRVSAGVTTRWHRLHKTRERYLIVEGCGLVEIDDSTPRNVGPGDCVQIPADSLQRISNTGRSDLIFLAVCTPRFTPECYSEP